MIFFMGNGRASHQWRIIYVVWRHPFKVGIKGEEAKHDMLENVGLTAFYLKTPSKSALLMHAAHLQLTLLRDPERHPLFVTWVQPP